jgi:hypothetical protein
VGAAAEANLDVGGGEAQLADAVDQVVADRVGGLVVVGGVQAAREPAVDDDSGARAGLGIRESPASPRISQTAVRERDDM